MKYKLEMTIPQLQSEIDELSHKLNYLKEQLKKLKEQLKKSQSKPILDKVEKEYLSAVIKPFKKKIEYIYKLKINDEEEYIQISTRDAGHMLFPNFKKGTMYKGMEHGKRYTLKELGL